MNFLNYPRNGSELLGSRFSQCFYWLFQVPEAGVETSAFGQGFKALSESGGHPGGHLIADSDSVASRKTQALEDLQRAWKSIRRMELLSDDPAESKVAGLALAFVDKAFAELE